MKSCRSWAEELPCSSSFLPLFLPTEQKYSPGASFPLCDFWHPVPQNTGSRSRMMATNSCPQAEKKKPPRGHIFLQRSSCRQDNLWHPITSTVKQINCLTQEKLFTGKNPLFGDPHTCLHTVNVLAHLWITFVFAAFHEEEKTWLSLVKIKRSVCKYCCSAFLPRRALHMSGGGSVTQRAPSGSTELRARWQQMQQLSNSMVHLSSSFAQAVAGGKSHPRYLERLAMSQSSDTWGQW